MRTPPRLISARQGIRVRGIVMRRRFVSRPWEEVGGVRSNVRAPPRLISARQGIGVRGISKRRRFVSRPCEEVGEVRSRVRGIVMCHRFVSRPWEAVGGVRSNTRPLGQAGGLSVFQKSHLTQLQGLGLARCRFWLEPIAKERASPVLGPLQQGSEFLLEPITRGGPPPGVGVENVWHTHKFVLYFQVKVHKKGPCSTRVFFGLKHTRREWGEVVLEI